VATPRYSNVKSICSFLARRFAPLDFSSVLGFPHPVPNMSEWGDFLPIFRENKEENPAKHLLKFHECMDLLDLQHEDVRMKMFMHSLYGDARQWYLSLPPSSISSLKDFHQVFNEHCKMYYSDEFAFNNCCEEYELHSQVENVNREEYLPHHLHHFSNDLHDDVFSHQHKLDMEYKGAECSLDTHGNDQLSVGQISIEISKASPQFSDLQIKRSGSNYEEQDFQKTSNLQEGQNEDYISPYVPYMSMSDEKDHMMRQKVKFFQIYFKILLLMTLCKNLHL
jgi:hypothetical protein